ncbi:hypothetical protein GCM10009772_45480 [Pseudonocardia alni subsp. carboxydivorans]|uniref:Uncharacterized protein n=1 Tax=Pseudonocardia alni subsp. carboxydivorans TaxID=415010 RepID=A0ABU9AED0_PSEA5
MTDLSSAVLGFGNELQGLLDGVLPYAGGEAPDRRQVIVGSVAGTGHFQVQVAAPNGLITLVKDGAPVAKLRITFQCTLDTPGQYLAIVRSDFELRELGDRTPIARLDYIRDAYKVPASHWNVHAERGSASRLLALGNPSHSGEFSKLHFPVGGARMRPGLEDFLAFVLNEFKVDRCSGADDAIREGRERWRRRQIATLVRDAPDEAVRVLTDLGYAITAPADGPKLPNAEKLQSW